MKRAVLGLCLFLLSFNNSIAAEPPATAAAVSLIKRILPQHYHHFKVVIADKAKEDFFQLESRKGKIILTGNNGVSIASALNYYLKYYLHCDITWNGTNLDVPATLPVVPGVVRKNSPYRHRYYLNYCTFNYSMSWWDWERWEQEIDWMALNGINMPLALTGQNSIWDRVYKSLGFTDAELSSFYSGPAYFNWFWMANFDGWNGPLPASFMQRQEALQKKILQRERELGMKPILPAFTGHVPPTFRNRFPQASLARMNSGGGFGDVYILNPDDTLFTTIGKKFMKELIRTFGTDHYYSADTFNENPPPSKDSMYLNDVTKKVYESMAGVDDQAVWLMQGWLFHISPGFWHPTQIKAVLNAVPDNRLMLLDLYAETHPIWKQTAAFEGKPWIWCMLHNFGGNISLFGRMDAAAIDPATALNSDSSRNMAGIGLTPEGIEQNPVMYELFMENAWSNQPISPATWLKTYAHRRYGQRNEQAEKGWEILRTTVYNGGSTEGGPESIITGRPTFEPATPWAKTTLFYSAASLLPAWTAFISAADSLAASDGFQYDLVDVSRQVLANYGSTLQRQFAADYAAKNREAFNKHSREFLELIDDMDRLLATRKDFLLGKWLNDAKKWGTSPDEVKLYEKNARDLVTLWGDKNSPLADYACKQWAGLLKGFYKKRWQLFFNQINVSLNKGEQPDMNNISEQLKNMEWQWVNDSEEYSSQVKGNPVTISRELYNKYYQLIETAISAN